MAKCKFENATILKEELPMGEREIRRFLYVPKSFI